MTSMQYHNEHKKRFFDIKPNYVGVGEFGLACALGHAIEARFKTKSLAETVPSPAALQI